MYCGFIDLDSRTRYPSPVGSAKEVFLVRNCWSARPRCPCRDWDGCGGSVALSGRGQREQGHKVRLIPAQCVQQFVKSNKNDYRDAEAIAEALERENMRFASIKTEDVRNQIGKMRWGW
jgi:hypothetical protein